MIDSTHWLMPNHDASSSFWTTSNAGATWTSLGNNTASHSPPQLPHAGSNWYVGRDDGIMRSTDYSHIPYKGFLEGAQYLAIDAGRHIIYAAHGSQGLHRVKYQ